ncbi:isoaspartyl peptidase/L-asparaginase [Bremerella sp. P1]|uniref:isoaspartyl peptidase/L-asparaginase n=1 Tax=Bremerella sp. P1 TaxID=3026424 RepID=UPI00236883FE|nr:isoaspartyl peptidase/L-asparaginase [Bremerella sp. P1]WDI43152.1 isoaspartyl peptidase/L-asparaginase [Bremerella sp. P1]
MKVIASHNGLEATRLAWQKLEAGSPLIDACVDGVTLVEDDPDELTVGYGGLPDEQGHVSLDAAVMDGRSHRGGSIIGLSGVRHVSKVALRLMRESRRVMLHGDGADAFARACGFPTEDLLTEKARKLWRLWKRTYQANKEWLPAPADDETEELMKILTQFYRHPGGTVHAAGQDPQGHLACVTSTSGHCFKTKGRVGDSPIFGAGLYVDDEHGTCGSIGHGEANLLNCSSFHAVHLMGQGMSPRDAGMATLEHAAKHAPPFELDPLGRPNFNLQLYLLAKDGTHAGVCLRGDWKIAITDDAGSRLETCEAMFPSD